MIRYIITQYIVIPGPHRVVIRGTRFGSGIDIAGIGDIGHQKPSTGRSAPVYIVSLRIGDSIPADFYAIRTVCEADAGGLQRCNFFHRHRKRGGQSRIRNPQRSLTGVPVIKTANHVFRQIDYFRIPVVIYQCDLAAGEVQRVCSLHIDCLIGQLGHRKLLRDRFIHRFHPPQLGILITAVLQHPYRVKVKMSERFGFLHLLGRTGRQIANAGAGPCAPVDDIQVIAMGGRRTSHTAGNTTGIGIIIIFRSSFYLPYIVPVLQMAAGIPRQPTGIAPRAACSYRSHIKDIFSRTRTEKSRNAPGIYVRNSVAGSLLAGDGRHGPGIQANTHRTGFDHASDAPGIAVIIIPCFGLYNTALAACCEGTVILQSSGNPTGVRFPVQRTGCHHHITVAAVHRAAIEKPGHAPSIGIKRTAIFRHHSTSQSPNILHRAGYIPE